MYRRISDNRRPTLRNFIKKLPEEDTCSRNLPPAAALKLNHSTLLRQPNIIISDTMKVLFVTNGGIEDPSSRVRVFQFLPFLRKRISTVDVIALGSRGARGVRRQQLKAVWGAWRYDVVVIQKTASPLLVRTIHKLNRRILWDIDDGVCVTYPEMNSVLPLFERVVVGNDELKHHVESFGGRATVLPSVVDETRFPLDELPAPRDQAVVGWIGHGANLRYLSPLRAVFERLAQKYPQRMTLKIVSSANIEWGMPIENKAWRLEEELTDIRSFTIGIMPLDDDAWSRQKCGYKALLYMSQGIPTIVSPIGVNARIIDNGVDGLLAGTPEEWERQLIRLIEDANLCRQLGAKAQEKIRREYTIAAVIDQWVNILKTPF
jgi:hypothetical protein